MPSRPLFCIAVLLAALSFCLDAEAARGRVVVLELKNVGGLEPGVVTLLNETLLAEMSSSTQHEVFGPSDIVSMLEVEQARQLMGCEDDSCLAEIGGALGAERIVASSVGKLGTRYILTLKLINAKAARVEARVSNPVGTEQDALYDGMRSSVQELVSKGRLDGGGGTRRTLGWVGVGTAVAAAAAGAAMFALGAQDASDAKSTRDRSEYFDLKDAGETKGIAGGALLGVAVLAGGLSAWLLTTESAPAVSLAPALHPQGGGVAFGYRW